MRNLTLAIDEDLLERARIIAVRRRTSLTRLVRQYLLEMVRADTGGEQAVRHLKALMRDPPLWVGEARWSREELHERE